MKWSHPFVVLGLVVVGAGALMYATSQKPQEPEPTSESAADNKPAEVIEESPALPPPQPRTYPSEATPEELEVATTMVTDRLKDPDSARIRNVRLMQEGGDLVCGEVNARNSFGGYTGFSHFVIMDGTREDPVVWIDEAKPGVAAAACGG